MKSIIAKLRNVRRSLRIAGAYYRDFMNYRENSLMERHEDVEGTHSLGLIIRLYHTIEKGLSVRDRKKEFSLANIELLQQKMLTYSGDVKGAHIMSAFKTLSIYFDVHQNLDVSQRFLDQREVFETLKKKYKVIEVGGGTKNSSSHKHIDRSAVVSLLESRHSIREYKSDTTITEADVIKVIDLAKLCPSACNRHAIKIYYSLDKAKNENILNHQNGSRTFRHNVPGLMIVTSDIRYQEGVEERNLGYIEGGIWIMSLINSLHVNGFASCVLNWCVSPEHDKNLKQQLNIPDYHQISALISFGEEAPEQKVPFSVRSESEQFLEKV